MTSATDARTQKNVYLGSQGSYVISTRRKTNDKERNTKKRWFRKRQKSEQR